MAGVEDLVAAQRAALLRLEAIGPSRYGEPTPCSEWSVRELVQHLLSGSGRAAVVLGGAEPASVEQVEDAALFRALAASFEGEAAAFSVPGAFDKTFSGPRGDMDGAFLYRLRTMEALVHAWDLGEALGTGDNVLPERVVETVWATMTSPDAAPLLSSGAFGEGASGTLGENAALQARLVELLGRRP